MIHCLWPSLIKEKKDYAEKWRNRSFEVADIRHLFLTSRILVKTNFISEEKLSKLFEHDDEAENKNDEELYFVKSLEKHVDNIFLVSEDAFIDI